MKQCNDEHNDPGHKKGIKPTANGISRLATTNSHVRYYVGEAFSLRGSLKLKIKYLAYERRTSESSVDGDIRRFELYDIFSVFLPGAAFLLALFPFLPQYVNPGSLQLLVPFLVAGFVVGRAIHSIAVEVERIFERVSHRERFANELDDPTLLKEDTIDAFLAHCSEAMQVKNPEDDPDSLYVHVRSYVHIDARGRSRTFQAIYSFHRSMWVVSLIVVVCYVGYGFVDTLGATENALNFQTHLGAMGLPPALVVYTAYIIALIGRIAFGDARGDYQEHFIQYLITDYINTRELN